MTRRQIVVDTAVQADLEGVESGLPGGTASFHAVGRPSLASVKHALSKLDHAGGRVTYCEISGVGHLEDDYMLLHSGQVIEIPHPELEVQSILLEEWGKTTVSFRCLGDVTAANIESFLYGLNAENSFHHYDDSAPGRVRVVFVERPSRDFEIGDLYKV